MGNWSRQSWILSAAQATLRQRFVCWSTQAPGDLSRALAALSSIKLPPLPLLTAPVPLPLFIVSDDRATRARADFKRCAFLLPSQINVFPTLILTQKHRPRITSVPSDTNTHILTIYTGMHTPYRFLLMLNPWINKHFNVKCSNWRLQNLSFGRKCTFSQGGGKGPFMLFWKCDYWNKDDY